MYVSRKSQITIKTLTENDELVTYHLSLEDSHIKAVNMKIVDGRRQYYDVTVGYLGRPPMVKIYNTLTELKDGLVINTKNIPDKLKLA